MGGGDRHFYRFSVDWGYFTLFEAFWNGRTPGKRVARIRVIQRSGRAIGLFESMARNLVRYVDQIPFFYAVGVIAMFATTPASAAGRSGCGHAGGQGPGRRGSAMGRVGHAHLYRADLCPASAPTPEPHTAVTLPATGIAKLSIADLEVLEVLRASAGYEPGDQRQALAQRIASALQAKSGLEVPSGASVETFLEATARQLRDRRGCGRELSVRSVPAGNGRP